MRRIVTRTVTTHTTVVWTISWSDAESDPLEMPQPRRVNPLKRWPRRPGTPRFGSQARRRQSQ
ncbi:MAG: hypothetical protein H0T53_03440 [Herpetosiphonaceae bacterium]|nr:hypothetical protein [Herpetosiphonaceae bacterium]